MAYDAIVDSAKLNGAMKATADAVRFVTGGEELIPWDTAEGFKESVEKVYEAGKKAEYDAFWDNFQNYGARRYYFTTFSNNNTSIWSCKNFKPKYDIICEGDCRQCFYAWERNIEPTDIGAILKKQGVILDTSKATNLIDFFSYGYSIIGELPTISCESAGANTARLFRGVAVTTIEKVIVTEQTIYTDWFLYSGNLENIVFEGTIAQNGLNFKDCKKLSKDSHISIVNAFSITATISATFSKVAVDKAFETSVGANDGSTSPEWLALVGTRPNVSILLA